MNAIACPYCSVPMETASPEKFQPCRSCGYSSARIKSGSREYLIIDSQLPDLMDNYDKLSRCEAGHTILIDRRIGHKHVAGADRRR